MKITVIGGGSSYTPELIAGLIEHCVSLGLSQVVLHDPNPERLNPVTGFCGRMARRAGSALRIASTESLDAALEGADFVVTQIRVGGQQARHEDICMGLGHGLIGQETTGVGGLAKALRTLPAMLEIARAIEARCPDAWLLNFTNPSGIVTEALLRHSRVRTVGLCNVPIEMHIDIARVLDRPRPEVSLDWVGLNHLGWVRKIWVDQRDRLPEMLERIEEGVSGPANLPEIDYPPGFLRALGMIPSSYVRFFYAPDEMLREIRAAPRTRAQEVLDIEAQLFAFYADPQNDRAPDLLSKRGGAWYSRLAVEIIEALMSQVPSVHIVNTTNRGAIDDLPCDAVVEVPCRISGQGIEPVACSPVEESILGLIRHVKAYERLAIEAAMTRSRDKTYQALVAHPLVPTARVARAVLDDLVDRAHVPR